MSKIELPTITSGYNLSTINNNFQKIEDELNNKVLYRDSPAGEPNSMSSNLDMNSRSILNANKISSNTLELGGVQVVPTDLAIDHYNGTREALRRSYAGAGYTLVDGSFEAGGTLLNANDVLLQERTGKAFTGPAGTVAAGTNPASGGFVDKSGELLSASAISNANGGSVQDFIDAQYTTVAELATGKFQVGQYVRLTDRGMGLFLVQSGGTADGYGVLDAGIGKTAQITLGGSSVNLEHLGAVNGQLSTSVMQYAADNYSAAYINGITLQCGEVDIPAKNFKFAAFGGGIVGVSGTYIFKQVKRGFLTEIDGVLCTGNSTLFTYVSDEASLPNHGQRYEYHITNCVLKQSTTLPAIKLYGAREGLISGCFFEGNGGVLTEFTINTVVSNCQFKNCHYMVLSKLGSEGLNVSGAIALGCSYGIRAERTTGVIIANSIIDYCDAPVFLQGATDVMITNNYISTRTANPAINAVKYPDGFRGINHTINGNTIKDNHSTTGSACVRYQENDFVIITNNALGNYASNGIVYDNITQSMISNNTFRQRSGLGTNAVLALTDNETVAISENITGGKAISRTHTTSTWNNFGFKTEASGEVSIPVGAATFDVTHGLAVTPSKSKVALQRTSVVNGGIQFYVSDTSSTTFTITFNSPLTNVVTMAWQYSTR